MRPWKILWMLCLVSTFLSAAPLQQMQPWLGVAIDEKGTGGILIKTVISKTPAEKAGLQTGDVITSIDETAVKNRDELMTILRTKGVGNSVTVHFTRQGKAEKKTLKLEALPDRVELMQKQVMNKPLPPFTVTAFADRKTINNQSLVGKVTILEFWATWCPACRSAIPRLNQWAKTHKNIQIIGITDEKEDVIREFLKKEKIEYTLAIDAEQKLQTELQIGSIPTFLLIDSKGVVREVALGAGEYLESLIKKAERLSTSP
ncbi:MAG: redoxin domain-containing protein [Pseudobdellovibrionaceae bacterium]|nr:redoxin domain-containing protein [Pseudobdellovibrionaceae bacterium]